MVGSNRLNFAQVTLHPVFCTDGERLILTGGYRQVFSYHRVQATKIKVG